MRTQTVAAVTIFQRSQAGEKGSGFDFLTYSYLRNHENTNSRSCNDLSAIPSGHRDEL